MIRKMTTAVFALVLLLPMAALAAPTQYQLSVDGLACPFCAYGIEKKLNAVEGVTKIGVDINAGTVTVTMAEGASMTKAQADRIVKDAGFTLRGFGKIESKTEPTRE